MSVAEAELLENPIALNTTALDFIITPWQPAVGAIVKGLRYSGGKLAEPAQIALKHALLQHGLLSFEPGTVNGQNFTEFLEAFGEVVLYSGPQTPAVSKETQANIVDSTDKRVARNYIWHIDQAFRPNPPNYTALFGKAVPEFGGDTLFSNAVAAYERLDPLFTAYLETLTAVHYWDATGHMSDRFLDKQEYARQRALNAPIETSIVRVHPETGKKQLFVNESYTTYIKGVSRTVSQSLLTILFEAIKSPEVQGRFGWTPGTLVLWDNRTVQHRGIGDFAKQSRVFYRACVN